MKIHFGFFENYGDYESPFYGCEETICGCIGENILENYTSEDWRDVTCQKCLNLKDKVIAGQEEDEKAIVQQMGEMADFFEKERLLGCTEL